MSACPVCTDASCKTCLTYLRMARFAIRRALAMPAFAEKLKLVGEVRSEPTDRASDGAVLEGALPADPRVEKLLMSMSRSVQGVVRAG